MLLSDLNRLRSVNCAFEIEYVALEAANAE